MHVAACIFASPPDAAVTLGITRNKPCLLSKCAYVAAIAVAALADALQQMLTGR
jgi:hypothetical protein